MRIALFLLFICVFQLVATDTNAQNAVIAIRQNNLSIKQLISEIEKQTNYLVVFRNQDVDVNQVVSFQRRSGKVSDYLDEVYKHTNLGYVFENNYITLSKKAVGVNPGKKKVTGKVTDENGEPVIGASVIEKGTTNGIMTDLDGLFTLEVAEAAVIRISYIGYHTKEIKSTANSTMHIRLTEDTQALDEVVVVGYGTQKKVNLTGAVEAIEGDKLQNRAVTNVSQALQGQVSGVNFTAGDYGFEPGADLDFQIRGQGSAYVLIDGVEGDMNRLNPNDIESVSVLKDAAAAAIYGARAPYGVVLITTKSGRKETSQYFHSQAAPYAYHGRFVYVRPGDE